MNVLERRRVSFRIEDKLVIAIASGALFDLTESNEVFLKEGVEKYRKYQRDSPSSSVGIEILPTRPR